MEAPNPTDLDEKSRGRIFDIARQLDTIIADLEAKIQKLRHAKSTILELMCENDAQAIERNDARAPTPDAPTQPAVSGTKLQERRRGHASSIIEWAKAKGPFTLREAQIATGLSAYLVGQAIDVLVDDSKVEVLTQGEGTNLTVFALAGAAQQSKAPAAPAMARPRCDIGPDAKIVLKWAEGRPGAFTTDEAWHGNSIDLARTKAAVKELVGASKLVVVVKPQGRGKGQYKVAGSVEPVNGNRFEAKPYHQNREEVRPMNPNFIGGGGRTSVED